MKIKKIIPLLAILFLTTLLLLVQLKPKPSERAKPKEMPKPKITEKKVFEIFIYKDRFVPEIVEIKVGEEVRWKNLDNKPHTLIILQIPIETIILPGKSFSFTFARNGTFDFMDAYIEGMEGRIYVS